MEIMVILLLIIIFSTLVSGTTSLVGAFLAGLLVDLWNGDRLGITSLIFVMVSFLLNLYKRKFNPEHLVFLLPFTMLIVALHSWIDHERQIVRSALLYDVMWGSVGIVVLWLFVRLWRDRNAAKGESI